MRDPVLSRRIIWLKGILPSRFIYSLHSTFLYQFWKLLAVNFSTLYSLFQSCLPYPPRHYCSPNEVFSRSDPAEKIIQRFQAQNIAITNELYTFTYYFSETFWVKRYIIVSLCWISKEEWLLLAVLLNSSLSDPPGSTLNSMLLSPAYLSVCETRDS